MVNGLFTGGPFRAGQEFGFSTVGLRLWQFEGGKPGSAKNGATGSLCASLSIVPSPSGRPDCPLRSQINVAFSPQSRRWRGFGPSADWSFLPRRWSEAAATLPACQHLGEGRASPGSGSKLPARRAVASYRTPNVGAGSKITFRQRSSAPGAAGRLAQTFSNTSMEPGPKPA